MTMIDATIRILKRRDRSGFSQWDELLGWYDPESQWWTYDAVKMVEAALRKARKAVPHDQFIVDFNELADQWGADRLTPLDIIGDMDLEIFIDEVLLRVLEISGLKNNR